MASFKSPYPFTALPNWITKKRAQDQNWMNCHEFCVLHVLQSFANGISGESSAYPSYKTICSHANVSKQTAIACIKSLQEKGLIEKQARKNENGQTSNVYYLKIWEAGIENRYLSEGVKSAEVVNLPDQGGSVSLTGGGQSGGTGGVNVLDPNKNHLTRKETPLTPQQPPSAAVNSHPTNQKPTQTAPEASARQQKPAQAPTSHRARQKQVLGAYRSEEQAQALLNTPARALTGSRAPKHVVSEPMVPRTLQPVASMICDFFNNHKGGTKTEKSFKGMITNLLRILEDKDGGIKAVKEQLRLAIERSLAGEKKWDSITYLNWERFGKKQGPAWATNNRPSTDNISSAFEEDSAHSLF